MYGMVCIIRRPFLIPIPTFPPRQADPARKTRAVIAAPHTALGGFHLFVIILEQINTIIIRLTMLSNPIKSRMNSFAQIATKIAASISQLLCHILLIHQIPILLLIEFLPIYPHEIQVKSFYERYSLYPATIEKQGASQAALPYMRTNASFLSVRNCMRSIIYNSEHVSCRIYPEAADSLSLAYTFRYSQCERSAP